MTYDEVYSYIYDKESYFPYNTLDELMEMLIDCDDDAFEKIKKTHLKSPMLIEIVSIFLGLYGIDRFLIKDYKLGLAKLLTGGGVFVLWITDIFTIHKDVKLYNYYKIKSMCLPSINALVRDISPK